MFKTFIPLILPVFLLYGCANLPKAEKIDANEASNFFDVSKNSNDAVVFFICGSNTTVSLGINVKGSLGACALKVNGVTYKQIIGANSVGRLNLKPGTYDFQAAEEDSLATYIPIKLEVKKGDLLLITQNFSHNVGLFSRSYIHTLEWTNNKVIDTVKSKQPFKMEP